MHYKNVTCSEPRVLKRFYGNAAGKQGEIHRIYTGKLCYDKILCVVRWKWHDIH